MHYSYLQNGDLNAYSKELHELDMLIIHTHSGQCADLTISWVKKYTTSFTKRFYFK